MMKLKAVVAGALLGAFFVGSALAQQAGQLGSGHVWGNPGAAQARASDATVTSILDRAFGSTQGLFAQRGASNWSGATPAALTANNDTNVTVTLGGTPASSLLAAASITMGWTGTLAAGRLNANVVQAFTNDTNVTASISAQNATLGWAGTLAIGRGGTGAGTQQGALNNVAPTPTRAGDIIYYNGSNWVALAGNNSGTQVLQENSSGVPSWATVAGAGTVTSVSCDGLTITSSGNCPTHYQIANCTITASVATNNLTVALKDNAGSDPTASSPCAVYFRNATLTSGTYVQRVVTAATSFTANSGSSFGCSTTPHIWVTLIDTGATAVLGVGCFSTSGTSAAQIFPLSTQGITTSTACSACVNATSAGVIYSTSAQTSKPYVIAGYLEWNSGLTVAGTWAAAPTQIQNYYPGMKLPGEVIQMKVVGLTATTTVNNTTTDITGATATFTPASAASLFKATLFEAVNTANSTPSCGVQIADGSNNIKIEIPTTNNAGAVTQTTAQAVEWIDGPATTSSVTYKGRGHSTGAANCIYNQSGTGTNSGYFKLEELQG